MTDQQKQRIINLRAEGKQYKEIAEELGLSLECVKMFMSRRKEEKPKCEQCGKKLRQDILRPARRFCSDRCRMKWWDVHPERMESKEEHSFKCGNCGRVFYSRKTRKFCSRLCYYKSLKHVG